MECNRHSRADIDDEAPERSSRNRRLRFWKNWLLYNSLISGILALIWLALRSGTRPSRLTYPCQQAAMSTAALAFGAPVVAAVIAGRQRLLGWARTPVGIAVAALGFMLVSGGAGYMLWASEYRGPKPVAPRAYRAELFHVTGCPQDPAGDRFVGLDNLLGAMGRGGVKLHESAQTTLTSGPNGIIAADDVVVIKINYQWDERGGSNTDVLRGLIRRIVDHPDTFTGEIVVCENAQFNSVVGFDRSENNAQDHSLSPHDVVAAFETAGYNVSHFDWTAIRFNSVAEYDAGGASDGYVVYAYDSELHGRISYPKFQTDAGTYISLKYGIWTADGGPGGGSYDRDRLKFINLPVLKSHHATYGATAAVKHYMGVVTRELSTSSHNAIRYGLMGATIGEIQLADLNILDAIWINANPYDGPWTSYAGATRRDELIAGVDPVAMDIWAVKNILIPAFLGNGYSPPWPSPSADPDDSTSSFRVYLDNSMYKINDAGYTTTNNLGQIDVTTRNGAAGDFDGDSDVDLADHAQFQQCFTGPGGGPVGPACAAGDFDGDDDIDCDDWEQFQFAWTGAAAPPDLTECNAVSVTLPAGASDLTRLLGAHPNPSRPDAAIEFVLGAPGRVQVRIFDVSGHMVRTLVEGARSAGPHTVQWDGRDDYGERLAGGVYFCQLQAPGHVSAKKIVLVR